MTSDLASEWFHGAERGSEDLSEEQCWSLLMARNTGRIAFVAESRILVLPVHYLVHEREIFFRTAEDGIIGNALVGAAASFQIDEVDPALLSGWSVLASGPAEHVEDKELLTTLWGQAMEQPWMTGMRNLFIRVTPSIVTGRRVFVS